MQEVGEQQGWGTQGFLHRGVGVAEVEEVAGVVWLADVVGEVRVLG